MSLWLILLLKKTLDRPTTKVVDSTSIVVGMIFAGGRVTKESDVKLTKFELEVMGALWELGSASVREVQERLPEGKRPAYTTVQTIVYRLEEKGAVRRVKKVGNAHVFEPVVTRRATVRRLFGELVGFFGGSPRTLPRQERAARKEGDGVERSARTTGARVRMAVAGAGESSLAGDAVCGARLLRRPPVARRPGAYALRALAGRRGKVRRAFGALRAARVVARHRLALARGPGAGRSRAALLKGHGAGRGRLARPRRRCVGRGRARRTLLRAHRRLARGLRGARRRLAQAQARVPALCAHGDGGLGGARVRGAETRARAARDE